MFDSLFSVGMFGEAITAIFLANWKLALLFVFFRASLWQLAVFKGELDGKTLWESESMYELRKERLREREREGRELLRRDREHRKRVRRIERQLKQDKWDREMRWLENAHASGKWYSGLAGWLATERFFWAEQRKIDAEAAKVERRNRRYDRDTKRLNEISRYERERQWLKRLPFGELLATGRDLDRADEILRKQREKERREYLRALKRYDEAESEWEWSHFGGRVADTINRARGWKPAEYLELRRERDGDRADERPWRQERREAREYYEYENDRESE